MLITISKDLKHVLDIWKSGQTMLPEVIRWKKYITDDNGVRPQNSLQHSYSLTLLGRIIIHQLKEYIKLDSELILTALHIHDHGEGEIKKDTYYINKTENQDLKEYFAFKKRFQKLTTELWDVFQKAFLLQFALKNPDNFPDDARIIMVSLSRSNYYEALAFDAIERWDYILYALEQYLSLGNTKIFIQTLRHQIPHLDNLAKKLPGFNEIWTKKEQEQSKSLLKEYEGRLIEIKGENY